MKKILFTFLASFVFLILFSGSAQAAEVPLCIDPATGTLANPNLNNNVQNFINNGQGLVPCGISISQTGNAQTVLCPCRLGHLFVMLQKVFRFLLFMLAVPIAGLMVVVSGLLILLSGADPNLASLGKKIMLWSIVGLVVMFCSWLIINVLMTQVLGITGWNVLPF